MKFELESKTYLYFSNMQMSAMLENTSGYTCFNGNNALFLTDPYKTLHICYTFIGLALHGLFKRNAGTFVFDLGELT